MGAWVWPGGCGWRTWHSSGLQDAHLWPEEDLGEAGARVKGDLGSGRVHGAGFCPPVSRVLWQVGWTRTNLAKKLLEKASGVTLVLKKVPLSPPGSPLSPRQQVSNPSAPSAKLGCAGNRAEPGTSSTGGTYSLGVVGVSPQNEAMLRDAGAEAPSPGARSLFGCCGSSRGQKQRVPWQPRVPDVQVSPGLMSHGPKPHSPIPSGTGSVAAAEHSPGQLPALLSNDTTTATAPKRLCL